MGTCDRFGKRKKDRQKRKHEFRLPRANSFLIVTEGKRTEPSYFKGLQQKIIDKVGGAIHVVDASSVPTIDIYGEGCGTNKLIAATERIVKEAKIPYQNIWVVFDKDDFDDFDLAIKKAKDKGYKVAWSNQSFEYWLFLHFDYSDSALHRAEWTARLNAKFKQYNLGDGTYHKNYKNIYDLVDTFDGVNMAIKHAKKRMAGFTEQKYSEYDPGTTVYMLVEDLKCYLE